ncbi:PP4C [Enterospora canceri]|uniref:Serine/threonine-protein phosphatase n=1 Tax=Enterospora canceri TaxID=1081671 RepID=A0A1Y1S6A6_9MICR|nr:PP4C [Enterospora canceri]
MFLRNVLQKIHSNEVVSEFEINIICKQMTKIAIQEPNIPFVSSPVCVLGDIHGQYSDLVQLLELVEKPGECTYVFLGDYVDRGPNSISVVLLLFCYKILYPKRVFMLRGNHEQRAINKIYGFYDETMKAYEDTHVWQMINEVFDFFSIAAVIDMKYFCVHGGISNRVTLNKLKRYDRSERTKDDDIANDLFWSDPFNKLGCLPNQRGSGVLFGVDIVKNFLMQNNLELIIRSHQLVHQGHKFDLHGLCLTIWSAPNYMNRIENPGIVLYIEPDKEINASSMHIYTRPLKK